MDAEVEALYGLPLDEFTKARDTLARARSKADGKEAGAAVKALRKPSVIAWALNQLARRHPDDVAALIEAGDRLRRAQTATIEGGDPEELREATRSEAGEVRALAGMARSILAEAGHGGSPTQEERLASTLRAAAVDPDGADQLRRGALTAELSPAGFGFGVADDAPLADFRASTPNSRASTHESRKTREDREAEERAEREAAAARREQQEALRAARETASRLAREADHAEQRAREARDAADAAARRVEELEEQGRE